MIRHDHASPECDIKLRNCAVSVLLQGELSTIERRNTFAVAGRKGDKVKWFGDVNQIKPMWTVLDHLLNCGGSWLQFLRCSQATRPLLEPDFFSQ